MTIKHFFVPELNKHWWRNHRCDICGRVIWGNGFFNHLAAHARKNPLIHIQKERQNLSPVTQFALRKTRILTRKESQLT